MLWVEVMVFIVLKEVGVRIGGLDASSRHRDCVGVKGRATWLRRGQGKFSEL